MKYTSRILFQWTVSGPAGVVTQDVQNPVEVEPNSKQELKPFQSQMGDPVLVEKRIPETAIFRIVQVSSLKWNICSFWLETLCLEQKNSEAFRIFFFHVVYKPYIISVNCQWSSWSRYSGCTKSCGGGTQFTKRTKTVQESGGGTCSGEKMYSRNCNIQSCKGKFTKSGIYVPSDLKH